MRKQNTQGHKARSQKNRLAGRHHHEEDEMRQLIPVEARGEPRQYPEGYP